MLLRDTHARTVTCAVTFAVTAADLPKRGGPARVTDPPPIFGEAGKQPPHPKWTVRS